MEILKRSLSALLVLVMVLGMLPMNTRAEEVVETIPAETVAETEAVETVPETEVSETIEVMVEEEAEPVLADAARTEAYIQDMIGSGETQIYIDEDVILENDFVIPFNVQLMIRNGSSITVPSGKRLIVEGRLSIWKGATLHIEEGGYARSQNYVENSGTMAVYGTFEGWAHTYFTFNNPTYIGVPHSQIWAHYVVGENNDTSNEEQFLKYLNLMETGDYGSYSLQIHGSMTVPCSFTIPGDCYFTLESRELTFTIPTGVMVTNKGTFNSYQNQTVQNNGVFENAGQINIQGPWLGNPVTAAKMTQDDLEAAIAENAEKGWSYHLTNEVILERDLILETGQLQIGPGGKLIAPNGIIFRSQAGIIVQPGGTLVAHADFAEDDMIGIVYDNGSMGKVTGIPESKLFMYYYVYSQEEFNNDLQVALDTNFARDFLYIWENVTLSKDTTIDEKTVVHMYGGKTLTVPADKTLTIKGGLCIWEGQTLVNNGTIDNYGFLDNWGTVTNNGTVNDSGNITIYGTWEGNQPAKAKMTQDDLEAALANAAATGSYYALKDEVVLERDLTVNTFFDISSGGHLVVPENVTLTLNQSISVMPGGVLEVLGDYTINSGIINVYNYGNGYIGTVDGVEMAHMCLNANANSESELLSALETAANTNYNFDCIYVLSSFELTKDAVIPQHCVIHMYNGATLTVQKGATLTNKGEIYLWNGQTLQNDGTIENDGRIHVVGQLTNNGTININENGFMGVDPNGAVQNNGTVKVDGLLDGPGTADGKPTYKWEGNPPVYPHTHAYTETVTAPTCTEKGYTTYTCECGDSYVDNYVDATGHSFGDWYVTKEATTEAEGQERRDCAACDHFETRAIPKVEIPTEGQCGGSLTWSYDKTTGTLTITGSGAMWNFTISLKQKSADPMVPWAAYQSEIKAVVLSEGITAIGNNAFAGCENLTEVTLPKTVTAIGEGAFLASGLKEITFQGDAPEVSESAFQGVSATITYPQDNETWTEDKKQDFGGDLTWDKPEDDHGYQLGDVNHDTKINAKDATLILQKSVGVLKETAKFCEDCAEVSGDGKLNAKDSTLILQFSVGLRTEFPRQK